MHAANKYTGCQKAVQERIMVPHNRMYQKTISFLEQENTSVIS
jgi:hypothetical protein